MDFIKLLILFLLLTFITKFQQNPLALGSVLNEIFKLTKKELTNPKYGNLQDNSITTQNSEKKNVEKNDIFNYIDVKLEKKNVVKDKTNSHKKNLFVLGSVFDEIFKNKEGDIQDNSSTTQNSEKNVEKNDIFNYIDVKLANKNVVKDSTNSHKKSPFVLGSVFDEIFKTKEESQNLRHESWEIIRDNSQMKSQNFQLNQETSILPHFIDPEPEAKVEKVSETIIDEQKESFVKDMAKIGLSIGDRKTENYLHKRLFNR